MKVILDNRRMELAAMVGAKRNITALSRGAVPHNAQAYWNLIRDNVIGASGELAVSIALNLAWTGCGMNRDGGDVGELEVKTQRLRGANALIIPDGQAIETTRQYVLVVAHTYSEFELAGWAWGWELAGRDLLDHYDTGRPCRRIPDHDLAPMQGILEAKTEVRDG